MTWQLSTTANLVIAAAYLAIAFIIFSGLLWSGQVTANRLGLATSLIFFTCAVHHGGHSVHMLLPSFGIQDQQALALRESWHWPAVGWDLLGAGVALFYLSVARYALEQGRDDRSRKAVEETLRKARRLVTDLLGEEGSEVELGAGAIRREDPAAVTGGAGG